MFDAWNTGRVVSGAYVVEERVAQTASAAVYRARRASDGVRVALKVVGGADRFERVRREAEALARLAHPNVVRVLDFGLDRSDGSTYLVLEWCAYGTLAELLAQRGSGLDPHQVRALLSGIVEGLAAAHSLGIVHGDLKPSNVMLDRDAAGRTIARVIDFGASRLGDSGSLGRTFSPAYAAPEQLLGEAVGPWTDVHAFGLLLSELVTGRRPYGEGAGLGALESRRPTPAVLGVDAGPLEAIASRCLARDARARFAHAIELRHALEATGPIGVFVPLGPLALAPTVAHDSSQPLASAAGHGRRRWGLGLTIAAVLFGGVLLLGALWVAPALVPGANGLDDSGERGGGDERDASASGDSSSSKDRTTRTQRRSRAKNRSAPTVALSSLTSDELERRATALGFRFARIPNAEPMYNLTIADAPWRGRVVTVWLHRRTERDEPRGYRREQLLRGVGYATKYQSAYGAWVVYGATDPAALVLTYNVPHHDARSKELELPTPDDLRELFDLFCDDCVIELRGDTMGGPNPAAEHAMQ